MRTPKTQLPTPKVLASSQLGGSRGDFHPQTFWEWGVGFFWELMGGGSYAPDNRCALDRTPSADAECATAGARRGAIRDVVKEYVAARERSDAGGHRALFAGRRGSTDVVGRVAQGTGRNRRGTLASSKQTAERARSRSRPIRSPLPASRSPTAGTRYRRRTGRHPEDVDDVPSGPNVRQLAHRRDS